MTPEIKSELYHLLCLEIRLERLYIKLKISILGEEKK